MFKTAFKLPFSLFKIPLYLDISFLFVFPLMVWMMFNNLNLAVQHLGLSAQPLGVGLSVLLATLTVIGLFTSIVLHELGHSLTARAYGVKVRRITLWLLGGVAEFEEMPRQRGAEAVVAIAGPVVSLLLAGLFFAVTRLTQIETVWLVAFFLAAINLMLAVFNLIPAMPMDGGRILRSLLAIAMPHTRATNVAGTVAKTIAVLMAIYGLGLFSFHNGVFSVGVGVARIDWWMLFLAFFIYTSATRETRYAQISHALEGLRVGDLMNPEVHAVPAHIPAGQLAQYIFFHHHSGFPVVDSAGRLVGSISLNTLETADPRLPVEQIMNADLPALTIAPDAPAIEAAAKMSAADPTSPDIGRLIVVSPDGQLLGLLTQADLARAMRLRSSGLPIPRAPYPNPSRNPRWNAAAASAAPIMVLPSQ